MASEEEQEEAPLNNNNLADAEFSLEDSRSAGLAASKRKVVVNVGGTKFRVKVANFARMAPKSRMSR